MLLGVDTGGTFTDFVLADAHRLTIHKVLSTPEAPEKAILQGIDELGLADAAASGQLQIVHGTTVATNAALEKKGVRTLFITNHGFGDMLTLGRQTRRALYDLSPQATTPPVPKEYCLEAGGRITANGEVIEPLEDQDFKNIKAAIERLKPEAVAINLLFSFIDDEFERELESAIPEHIFASRSSAILPEYKEYERGMATWLNAWLGPRVEGYMTRLGNALAPAPVDVMQSNGGTFTAQEASRLAVNILLSGPAGGLAAALKIGDITDSKRLLTFDMGGTSTDVAMIDGGIKLTNEGRIGDYPVAVPMVDMHTIGAGGGSIAYIDEGGMLQVGPESAGANPGPACYQLGGKHATVTDANLVLGFLPENTRLGGKHQLSLELARQSLSELAEQLGTTLEETAQGIITIANEHMSRALRVISVQRGYDPKAFCLTSFGGAGGLHVCALADALAIKQAIVPIHSGALSALGLLAAPRQRHLSQSFCETLCEHLLTQICESISALRRKALNEMKASGVSEDTLTIHISLDLRYIGQSYTLTIPWENSVNVASEQFHQQHQQRYGHRLDRDIEVVNIRLSASAQIHELTLPEQASANNSAPEYSRVSGEADPVSVIGRDQLEPEVAFFGPLIIRDTTATTWVARSWQVEKDRWGNLLLRKREAKNNKTPE